MPGLVPGIHVLGAVSLGVDGRDKPGHDAVEAVGAPQRGPDRQADLVPVAPPPHPLSKSHVRCPERSAAGIVWMPGR